MCYNGKKVFVLQKKPLKDLTCKYELEQEHVLSLVHKRSTLKV